MEVFPQIWVIESKEKQQQGARPCPDEHFI